VYENKDISDMNVDQPPRYVDRMAGSYSTRLSRRDRVVVGGHHFCTSRDECYFT